MSQFQLHHIAPLVLDVDASAAFYKAALGLGEIPNRVVKAHIRWWYNRRSSNCSPDRR